MKEDVLGGLTFAKSIANTNQLMEMTTEFACGKN